MTGVEGVQLIQVIVHKIGNSAKGEDLRLSQNTLTLNDELVKSMLVKYFLGSINENEHYHFTHISDLNLNEVYNYVTQIFDEPDKLVSTSALLAHFLYTKSTHARIKDGELYIAIFNDVPFQSEYVQAIGIFKSENKDSFLKVFEHGKSFEVISEEGININKADKGCLVFRRNQAEGYTVCVVDNTNKNNEAQYWVNDFLQVEPNVDNYHHTKDFLGMCKQFITHEYAEKFEVSKSDQIDLLNRSIDYFKTNDQFNLDTFAEAVIHHDEVIDTFKAYKQTYENACRLEIEEEFDINLSAVKKQAKVFKSVLKLDKNFHIYIHGRKDLIEKGYDELTGKQYYKLYFDEES